MGTAEVPREAMMAEGRRHPVRGKGGKVKITEPRVPHLRAVASSTRTVPKQMETLFSTD